MSKFFTTFNSHEYFFPELSLWYCSSFWLSWSHRSGSVGASTVSQWEFLCPKFVNKIMSALCKSLVMIKWHLIMKNTIKGRNRNFAYFCLLFAEMHTIKGIKLFARFE